MTTRTNKLAALTAAQTRLQTATQIRDAVKGSGGAQTTIEKCERDITREETAVKKAQADLDAFDALGTRQAVFEATLAKAIKGSGTGDTAVAPVDPITAWNMACAASQDEATLKAWDAKGTQESNDGQTPGKLKKDKASAKAEEPTVADEA